jgi:hypothetical protein
MPSPAGLLLFFTLYTNGFVNPTKIDATNRAISYRNPDSVVITETKPNTPSASKMDKYKYFEECGTPSMAFHT